MSGTASSSPAEKVVIVGGGISGLSTAFFLQRRGIAVEVLEAADRWGGVISSRHDDGYLIETGPNSLMQKQGREDDAIGRVIDGSALEAEVQQAGAAGKKRFIMRGGRLLELPGSPPAFLTSPVFSPRGKLRLLAEPFIGRAAEEESIAAFVTRRLGREFLDYGIQPFVSGVFAGDANRLSVRAAVPRIWELERDYGSLIKGAFAQGKAAKGAGMPAGRMISFRQGLGALPQTLAQALPEGSRRTGVTVNAIVPGAAGGWTVHWQDAEGASGSSSGSRVVLSVPAAAAATLLEPLSAPAAQTLRAIEYCPVVTIGVAFDRAAVRHALDGFGFLLPRVEHRSILGALFSSTLFPGRAPEGKVLVTVFIGGTTNPELVSLPDDRLKTTVLADLAAALGAAGEPERFQITRYQRAIPQYTLGHLDRVARIRQATAGLPTLHYAASWAGGVAVGDCLRSAERSAIEIADAIEAAGGVVRSPPVSAGSVA